MDNVINFIEVCSSEEFGHSCRRIRYINNISQEKLALEIGVSTSTIQRIENGRMAPSIDLVCKIAKGHGMKVIIVSSDISKIYSDHIIPSSIPQG
ncbi:helix-turn-helix transcriptional regulator [Hahella chejuensis]|uniref:helix-turn-helix transcriptional regulator n=1 Tax=Hahella chejuensis TaxID=158327 RepID=UPI0005A1723A|nr:helix-turn-helix transcriptional regulator [Hahella chejuensis]